MKIAPTFEIKVAFIGNVSAGKTTVLNALLRDKFGEVSMKRTTAGVNYFRISGPRPTEDEESGGSSNQTPSPSPSTWSMMVENPCTAQSALETITLDNKVLRECNEVQDKTFDIELQDELCEMRPDTKLVLVDIPGLNEAGTESKYKDWVATKWESFDCAIIVMDGRQGVNTEEQVSLVKFVKENLDNRKDIPVMILCNKIDDPEDDEQAEMIMEARREIEKIFHVDCREKALDKILARAQTDKVGSLHSVSFPIFIPISGVTAFIFRCCSTMTISRFREFDPTLITKLGRDRIGKHVWRKMTQEQRVMKAYEAVTDAEQYQEGLAESNFDTFLTCFGYFLGGDGNQREMLKRQIEVSFRAVSLSTGIAKQLRHVHDKAMGLDRTSPSGPSVDYESLCDCIKTSFWEIYNSSEDEVFGNFGSFNDVPTLATLASELSDYYQFVHENEWHLEQKQVIMAFKNIVLRQIYAIISKYHESIDRSKINQDDDSAHPSCVEKATVVPDARVMESMHPTNAFSSKKKRGKDKVSVSAFKDPLPSVHEDADTELKVRKSVSGRDEVDSDEWSALSPVDWARIFDSLTLLSYDIRFCQAFGREKIHLQHLSFQCLSRWAGRAGDDANIDQYCPSCGGKLDFNRFCKPCWSFVVPGSNKPQQYDSRTGQYYSERCQRRGKCTGSLDYKTPRKCTICRLGAIPDREVHCDATSLLCSFCAQRLDFNRWCSLCDVYFCQRGSLDDMKCPTSNSHTMKNGQCGTCKYKFTEFLPMSKAVLDVTYNNGQVKSNFPDVYAAVVHYDVPESLTDPKHMGHVAWRYCQFMATVEATNEEGSKLFGVERCSVV